MQELENFTHLELLDLQNKIQAEFKNRENREKHLVYTVFVPFVVNEYYLKKENAISALKEYIDEYDYVSDFKTDEDCIKIGIAFIDKSGLQFCKDYED